MPFLFCFTQLFQSTPSARRATVVKIATEMPPSNFNPRPPRGGRPRNRSTGSRLRNFNPRPPRGGRPIVGLYNSTKSQFQSTPSARRATRRDGAAGARPNISIHALREEGDGFVFFHGAAPFNFNPRPPRGGRRRAASSMIWSLSFQSTPSARRATLRQGHPQRPVTNFNPRPPRGGRPLAAALV